MPKVKIKEVPMGNRRFTISDSLVDAFSIKCYTTDAKALGEILGNARDACLKAKKPIAIHINTYGPDSPWFEGDSMVITDRGCGFPTKKAWDDYLLTGGSVSADRADLFGVNGVGKFAPLFFAGGFTVRTCHNNGMDLEVVHINRPKIFSQDFQFFLGRRGDLPTDPESGSFTSIIVENMRKPYPAEKIMADLTNVLVIEPRIITVNGAPLPERKTVGEALRITTKSMPKIGVVSCEIQAVEKGLAIDTIKLLGGGREICTIGELPAEYRRMLDPVFLDPSLVGWIDVEKWLKKSTVSKDRLDADALGKADWSSFVKALNLYLKKPFVELVEGLGRGVSDGEQVVKTLRSVTNMFQKVWPIDTDQASKFGFGGGDLGSEDNVSAARNPNHKPGGTKKPAEPTDDGSPKGHTKKPGQGKGTRSTRNPTFLIQIQDETYMLWPAATGEQVTAYVKPGNIVVIDLAHPAFLRIKKRGVNSILTFLEQVIVEAHVLNKFPTQGPLTCFAQVNHILAQMK